MWESLVVNLGHMPSSSFRKNFSQLSFTPPLSGCLIGPLLPGADLLDFQGGVLGTRNAGDCHQKTLCHGGFIAHTDNMATSKLTTKAVGLVMPSYIWSDLGNLEAFQPTEGL
jgi:hypothetical protein